MSDKYSCKRCKAAGDKHFVPYKIIEDDGNRVRFIGMLCEDCFDKIFDSAPSTDNVAEKPEQKENTDDSE